MSQWSQMKLSHLSHREHNSGEGFFKLTRNLGFYSTQQLQRIDDNVNEYSYKVKFPRSSYTETRAKFVHEVVCSLL